jgi:hypothetical protein
MSVGPSLVLFKKRTKNISSARLAISAKMILVLGLVSHVAFVPVLFFLKKEPKTLALRGW